MSKPFIQHFLSTYKAALLWLASLELVSSLLILAIAWQFTGLIAGVASQTFTAISETAPVLLALFLMLCLRLLLTDCQRRRLVHLSTSWREQCRQKIHTGLTSQSLAPADLSILAVETIDALDNLLSQGLPVLLALVIRTPVLIAAASVADPFTALLFALTLPIAPFLLYLIGQTTKAASQREWAKLEELATGFQQMLRSMLTIKLFGQERTARHTLHTLSHDFATAALQVLKLAFASAFALELITTLSIAIIAVSTGLRLLDGTHSFPAAFFLLLLAPEFYQPLRQGGIIFHAAIESLTAWQKLKGFGLTCEPPATENARHEQLQVPPAISVQRLSYHYPGTAAKLFEQYHEDFPAVKISVITGPSGCGKSTLLKLLAGLLSPAYGTILLNDQPLATMAAASRQKLITYVPQQPHIYDASLKDNVSLFQEVPDERVRQALRLASLEDWFLALPDGLATPLGDSGLPLSQGQRNRLGLARALLQNRPIALLDEPTAGMDEQLEQQLLRTLTAFAKRRTLIIISHHPAVQSIADKCITLSPAPEQEATP
ncbi:ATP-binding cassette, subfamily C, CydD [Selenomonas sp. GACV-9]|uniref:ABC transporter ATP-binding protein/permease n=1 Tax=Selenomonas sp. GACV-9 TaxID=3158782 RepID=UPI0008F40BC2|nr:ATP-binding cassette, subfamily C, CydD [Selenomonas ruminantium]